MKLASPWRLVPIFLSIASPAVASVGVSGTMSNFDVFNETGTSVEGAEIELEDLHLGDVAETYTWTHFPRPTVTEYVDGATNTFGVRIRYSSFDALSQSFTYSVTPTVGSNTNGHQCVMVSGCEHFGFSISKQPTATRYFWLDHPDGGTPAELVRLGSVPMQIATPVWSFVPANNGQPAQLQAEIKLPEPVEVPNQKPDAVWVKIFKTETKLAVKLEDLMSGNDVVPEAESETEMEWKLLENSKPFIAKVDVADASKSVVRRYEFYKYVGLVDEENGPICDDACELDPQAVGALGDFIGAQMAAANIGEVAAVPEPETYAMFLAGLGIVGYRLRSRRKTAR